MAMTNGYTHGPPTYSPYHPPSSAGGTFDTPDPSSASGSEPRRPRLAPPGLGSYQHPGMSGVPPFGGGGPSGLSVQYPSNHTLSSTLDHEDDANRSRNARAQRRHREKRKAHVKNLEDSVVSLNAQLEDARRQLTHYHPSDARGLPPPDMQELHHLRNENMMLRDENADLRRQLSYPRTGGGSGSGGPGGGGGFEQYPGNGHGNASGGGSGGHGHMPPPQHTGDDKYAPLESPRLDRDGQGEMGSMPSSGFLPPMDGMTPVSRGSRDSRIMSAGSGPGASPYITSSGSFISDPRHHSIDGRYSSSSGSSQRYDHSYTPDVNSTQPPPPHTMPRSDSGVFSGDGGFTRDGSGNGTWDNGPPPFPSSTSSYMSYPGQPPSQSQSQPQSQSQSGAE